MSANRINLSSVGFPSFILKEQSLFLAPGMKAVFRMAPGESQPIYGEAIMNGVLTGWHLRGDVKNRKSIILSSDDGTVLTFHDDRAKKVIAEEHGLDEKKFSKDINRLAREYRKCLKSFLKGEWQYVSYTVSLMKDNNLLCQKGDLDIPDFNHEAIMSGRNIILRGILKDHLVDIA